MDEKRIDPEDEQAYTLNELVAKYKDDFKLGEIHEYFAKECIKARPPSFVAMDKGAAADQKANMEVVDKEPVALIKAPFKQQQQQQPQQQQERPPRAWEITMAPPLQVICDKTGEAQSEARASADAGKAKDETDIIVIVI